LTETGYLGMKIKEIFWRNKLLRMKRITLLIILIFIFKALLGQTTNAKLKNFNIDILQESQTLGNDGRNNKNTDVVFEGEMFKVNIVVVGNGLAISNKREVEYGTQIIFSVLPMNGNRLDSIVYNGKNVTEKLLGQNFIVSNVSENGIFYAYFSEVIAAIDMPLSKISVYPNPASDQVRVNVQEVTNIQIYDSRGVVVESQRVYPFDDHVINIGGLKPGPYVMKIESLNHKENHRLIVK